MAKSKDHYVQATYMGLWSVHGPQNRKGRVQWMDKDSAATGWQGPTAIENLLAQRGYDELTGDEASVLSKLLGVAVALDSWEKEVVRPIEREGYLRLMECANLGKDGQFSPTAELFSWLLLQMVRTPARRARFNQSAASQLEPTGHPLLEELLSDEGVAVLYLAFKNEVIEDPRQSVLAHLLHTRVWSVQSVICREELVGSDNPILLLGHDEDFTGERRCFVVPLGPSRALYGVPPGEPPQRIIEPVVKLLNSLWKENARRWLFKANGDTPFTDAAPYLPTTSR